MKLSDKPKERFDLLKSKGRTTLDALLQAIEPPPFNYTLQLTGKPIEADYTEFAGRGFFVISNCELSQVHILDDKTFDGIEETKQTRDLVITLTKLRADYRRKKTA